MRKSQLRDHVDNYFQYHHTGSYRARKHSYFVLHKVIRDLFQIGNVPSKWHALTLTHIQQLVSHWKKENLKPSTLMRYMTALRGFLKNINHRIDGIGNLSLGVTHDKKVHQTFNMPAEPCQRISQPIARILFELQCSFGLTLSEAMHLIPSLHLQDNTLWITRNMATNHQDRIIPIRNDTQRRIISTLRSLCSPDQDLIANYGYQQLRYLYTTELKKIGLPLSKNYRYLYARSLYAELSKTFPYYLVCQTIMRDMGIKSRTTLWSYLHE